MRRATQVALVALGLASLTACGGAHPASGPSGSAAAPVTSDTSAAHPKPTHLTVAVAPWRLPYAIAREAVIATGPGQVLVGGGMFPGDTSSARSFELTLATGRATALPSMSVDVHDVAGGLYAGAPAVYGGGNATEQSIVQQFRGGAWRVVDHMPTTRSDLSVAMVGTTTYVLGGYDGTGVPTSVLAQSGSGGLKPAGHLVEGVRYAASAVVGTSIYLFGGEVSGAELGVVQRYDTVSHTTTVVARLPVPLGHASAAVLGGRILLMGGRIQPDVGTRAMWWFDATTHRFSRAGELPSPITDAAVAMSADGLTAWLLGGEAPSVRADVIRLSLS